MSTPLNNILRTATRKPDEPLNILTAPTHEAYETNLAKTGHNFWAYRCERVKDWNSAYRPLPSNYVLLNPARGEQQIPPDVDFDLVLAQNIFGQYQVLRPLADKLHLPLVRIEHTLPMPSWSPEYIETLKYLRGDINLFISAFSREKWGFSAGEARVIHHGLDTELFKPDESVERRPHLLSVVNDWKNRDWCCGYKFWEEATKDLPARVVGDTPGLSKPAPSVAALVKEYQYAQIFINTSLISPVPTALLEAMSCGCAVISTATCMIPEVITNGVDGILCNTPQEMREAAAYLLKNPEMREQLGQAARATIEERFSRPRFVSDWNKIFAEAATIPFLGER